MRLLEISNEVRAVEVHQKATSYYQASEQFGYKFLMEVKIIRDEKLFKDLGYEDFEQYTQLNFNYSRNTMNERILSAEAFGEEYNRALGSYGKHKTRQLAQMPEKERQQALEEGIPTDEGIKPIEEATTREIDRYQKQLKAQEEHFQAQLKQKDELIESMADSMHDFELQASELESENETLKNRKPEVIEKEVPPEDYEDLKRTTDYLTKRNEHLEREHQELLNQRKEVNEKSQKYDELTNAIQQSQGELNRVQQKIADYDGLHKVLKEGNALLAKLSVLVYSDLSDAVANDTLVKNELDILLSRFLKLNEDITKKITNNMIIEGEIIND